MGSRIAAHMTNAGLPVVLLDIVPPGIDANAPKPERNKIVLAALDGLKKSKPAAFYSPDNARLITIGNFDDDLALVAGCDWIIEVVAENMEIKRALRRGLFWLECMRLCFACTFVESGLVVPLVPF